MSTEASGAAPSKSPSVSTRSWSLSGKASAAALTVALTAASPLVAGDDTASGTARAAIVEPIAVSQLRPLVFGTLALDQGGSGSITVDAATGALTYAGALRSACASSASCAGYPAMFLVKGEAGRGYRIVAPDRVQAYHAGSGASLPVSGIAVALDSAASVADRGLLDQAGEDRFRVGGTLDVASGSASGLYRADIPMVVTYD